MAAAISGKVPGSGTVGVTGVTVVGVDELATAVVPSRFTP